MPSLYAFEKKNTHKPTQIEVSEKTRRKGKIVIKEGINPNNKRVVWREKHKNKRMIYKVYYNEKGKIDRSINRKGVEKQHKRGCNCS